jgi:hypothetical protein
MLRIGRIVACVFLAATSAQAQELAGTFEQVRVLVKAGDTLTVTDTAGQPVRGKLVNLSSSSLRLNVSGTTREFQKVDVNTITKRGSDSLKNGALIGVIIGGGFGVVGMAVAAAQGDADAAFFVGAALVYGGMGAGIGAGVDALIEGQRVIYANPGSPRARLSVAPVLRGPRKGVLVSLRLTK